ncbi:hypothetical protein COCSUDRAFT_53397 [Coccomyxa subellipsoidea C-169]|uniref:DNA/RNA-binding protein Alba-like domain-containing protein n=1 Tax=Coccomyxa subellipsoidea (strain C-169) TaxID=574566 RepID=I0YYW5_COCSC|nr:hypothetical protein COCSUDRAFT_53397 [Coccomyxa subellipsoidea C-169]EIE23584.1 hypothetical protein COCSUDRAFT_53397 [Coccomyxa subellipsoidea C-169]|eukprot:XP_005648128.1 hypothetical protein COCSUDRAFT_53397 [Coccomyxa subellipsoidea C-169]
MSQQTHPARIQVSTNKKPLFFYVNLAKRFLQEHGEVQLSALGLAISSMVTVAEILKSGQWAVEKKITTGLDTTEEEGRDRPMQKAKMEIILTKSPHFDELMAASASQQHSGSSGPQAPGGHPPGMGPSSQPQGGEPSEVQGMQNLLLQ